MRAGESGRPVVAIVGMGYVGLPTALALHATGVETIGLDVDEGRLAAIKEGQVDLVPADHRQLGLVCEDPDFRLTNDAARLAEADTVIVCVPTPLDSHLTPDLRALTGACRTVVDHARAGQTLILTSTSFVGTTRDLLAKPLREKGFEIGVDIFVAFSPERIDPGNSAHVQTQTPRVIGGVTAACAARATRILDRVSPVIHSVSSAEAAELTKLYENSFRAVVLALANEFADICGTLHLDPLEVTLAAATKPYGFLKSLPGPGIGGHCIPCDPHYLLWQLRESRRSAPIVAQAMTSIAQRPQRVVDRAAEIFSNAGRGLGGARVLVLGVAYKPGVRDLRESSALGIINELGVRGAKVDYYDPLVDTVLMPGGRKLTSVVEPNGADWDLILVHTVHPGHDYAWAGQCPFVVDATYQFTPAAHSEVV